MHTQPNNSDSLIVGVAETLYGINAHWVREVVRLPEISPMQDAPLFIVGVINLRGRVVPVLDLNNRLGHISQEKHRLSDAVVVLERGDVVLGLLVNEVREIVTLDKNNQEPAPLFEEFADGHDLAARRYRFVQGVAKIDDSLIMLLSMEHLLHVHPSDWVAENAEEEEKESAEQLTARRRFNPEGDATARTVFQQRAKRLRQRLDQHQQEETASLAIIRLHNEMLGIDLRHIAGFAKVVKVTPIPCCPPHIVGSMNLRGDVLVLVDLRQVLNLSTTGPEQTMGKAVVIPLGQQEVGVLVHDVVDVIHIRPTEIAASPVAASSLRGEHLQGAMPYDKKMLGILNVQAILANPALLVNEEM